MKDASDQEFTHLDEAGRPQMVNVGGKPVTHRKAHARSTVLLPAKIMDLFEDGEIKSRKGPVFQTAIIAGTMAAKKTSELIPLCHPLPIEDCKIVIEVNNQREVVIDCTTEIHHKTGVEMEAMTGATVAALTIYDMCKGLSRSIVIGKTRLIEKTGGQHDYKAEE